MMSLNFIIVFWTQWTLWGVDGWPRDVTKVRVSVMTSSRYELAVTSSICVQLCPGLSIGQWSRDRVGGGSGEPWRGCVRVNGQDLHAGRCRLHQRRRHRGTSQFLITFSSMVTFRYRYFIQKAAAKRRKTTDRLTTSKAQVLQEIERCSG